MRLSRFLTVSTLSLTLLAFGLAIATPLQAQDIRMSKNDADDDDVGREGPPFFQTRATTAPARIHWVISIRNLEPTDQVVDFVLDDVTALDVDQGTFPPPQTLDCSVAPGSTGSLTAVNIECPVAGTNDPGTPYNDPETIRFTNITVPAGGTVELDFWAEVTDPEFEGLTCNAPEGEDEDGDPLFLEKSIQSDPPEGACISVGAGQIGTPIFTKDDGPDDDVEMGQQGRQAPPGGDVHWILNVNNPLAFAASSTITDDLPDGQQTVDCSTIGITSDCGWIHPNPSSCCDASQDPEINCRLENVPSGCLVTIDFWAMLDPNLSVRTCNQGINTPDQGPGGASSPPEDINQMPTCILPVAPPPTAVRAKKAGVDDNGGDLVPGDTITWTITLFNDSGQQVTTSMTDVIEPAQQFVAGSLAPFPGATCQENDLNGDTIADEIACQNIVLAANSSADLTFQTTLTCENLDLQAGACNQATFDTPQGPVQTTPPGSQSQDPTCLPVSLPWEFDITKTVAIDDANGNGSLNPGEEVTWTVTATNTGSADLTNVEISDAIPGELTYVAGSITVDGASQTDATGDDQGEISAGTVRATAASLAVGSSLVLEFRMAAPSDAPDLTQACNNASVTSDETTQNCPADFSTGDVCAVIERPAELQLTKSVTDDNGGQVLEGDVLTWSLELCNVGDRPANTLEINDTVPVDTTYVANSLFLAGFNLTDQSGDDPGEFDGSAVHARPSNLNPGQCLTMTYQSTVDAGVAAGTVITNIGDATAQGPALSTDSNEVSITVGEEVTPPYELTISKEATDDQGAPVTEVEAGDTIVYVVDVCNDGPNAQGPAPMVQFSDTLPAEVDYTAETIQIDGVGKTDAAGDDEAEFDGTAILADLGDIALGACVQVTFEVTVPDGTAPDTQITNQADAAGEDGAGASVSDSAGVTVVEPPIVREMLRGMTLRNMTDPATEQCPAAAEQLPRLDPALDLCDAGTCPVITPDTEWQILGDGAFDGTRDLWHYEVTNVPCSETLFLSKDPANRDDLLGTIQ